MTAAEFSPAPIKGTLAPGAVPPRQSLSEIEQSLRCFIAGWNPASMGISDPLTANERDLASSLCIYLDQTSREVGAPYRFHHQPPFGQRSLDIGLTSATGSAIFIDSQVFRRSEFFYCIEAKLLPLRATRQREYVVSDFENLSNPNKKLMGGIERFKQGVHAPSLSHSSMVAFVQEVPSTPWLAVINGWITELTAVQPTSHQCAWTPQDVLSAVRSDGGIEESTSRHCRPDGSEIHLSHFWLYLAGTS
jgi:hypothetical protein